jgi:hypothetical protein
MKKLIEYQLADGSPIWVEVDEPEIGGVKPVSRSGEVVEKAKQTFNEALDKVKPIAETIIDKLRNLSDSPDEVEVKFGLKMNAAAGAIIAAAGVEANYEITLKWTKK